MTRTPEQRERDHSRRLLEQSQNQDGRLAALVDAYAEADSAVKAAEQRRKDLRDELLLAHDDLLPERGELQGSTATVRISQTSSWRVDTKRLKEEQPVAYAAYAVESKSTRLLVTPR